MMSVVPKPAQQEHSKAGSMFKVPDTLWGISLLAGSSLFFLLFLACNIHRYAIFVKYTAVILFQSSEILGLFYLRSVTAVLEYHGTTFRYLVLNFD